MNPAKAIIALILLLLAANLIGQAKADEDSLVYRGPEGVMVLSKAACSSEKILDSIVPEKQKLWHDGTGTADGKKYQLCWAFSDPNVIVLWEDGDVGVMPTREFSRATGL